MSLAREVPHTSGPPQTFCPRFYLTVAVKKTNLVPPWLTPIVFAWASENIWCLSFQRFYTSVLSRSLRVLVFSVELSNGPCSVPKDKSRGEPTLEISRIGRSIHLLMTFAQAFFAICWRYLILKFRVRLRLFSHFFWRQEKSDLTRLSD